MYVIEKDNGQGGMELTGQLAIPLTKSFRITSFQDRLKTRMRELTGHLRAANRNAFHRQGHQDHNGLRWRRLEKITEIKKGKTTILVDKGAMRRMQSVVSSVRLAKNVVSFKVTLVNRSPYGHLHQFGFNNMLAGKFVEARPPVWVSHKDAEWVQSELNKMIVTLPTKRT